MSQNLIYFDNSATTFPKPEPVKRAVMKALTRYAANPGRAGHQMSIETGRAVFQARSEIASFFHMQDESRVIFTPSCTASLNMVIEGVLKKGDHVVISSLEHNAVLRPLEQRRAEGLISYSIAHVFCGNDEKTIDSFRSAINERTRLMICTEASNVFGVKLPTSRLCALAHQYHILFAMDAAQTAGVVEIDMERDDYDFVACAGHKSLYAPMGCGLLLINKEMKLRPLIQGGTGSLSDNRLMPDFYPDRLEAGTLNIPAILGLQAGVRFVKTKGIDKIFHHEIQLIQLLYDSLKESKEVELVTPYPTDHHFVPVLSFGINGYSSEEVARMLDERYHIATRAGLHCAPLAHQTMHTNERGTIRVSPSLFSNERQILQLIFAVREISMTKKTQ